MKRTRQIAGSPFRDATDAWVTLRELVANSVSASPAFSETSVRTELRALDGLGAALVGGGHLDVDGVTLVADPIYVTITIASGDKAFQCDENLAPIPGGASATSWNLYLPDITTLHKPLADLADSLAHVHLGKPPAYVEKTAESATIDAAAFRASGGI